MIDGLALGETTPGPLIMVVTFVGFVGGWTKAFLGPNALAEAGIVAAVVVTFFTFLPSFLSSCSATAVNQHAESSLHGSSFRHHGAVVGVILNLALFLPSCFWPQDSRSLE